MEDQSQGQSEGQGAPQPPAPQAPVKAEYRIGDWLGKAWKLATAQIWPMVLLGVIGIIIPGALTGAVSFPIGFAIGQAIDNQIVAQLVSGLLGGIAGWIITAVVITQLMVGIFAVVLAYIRTGEVNFSLLGTGFNKWTECFMLAVWPGILFAAGSALSCFVILVLPLYLALTLWYNFGQFALAEAGVTQSEAVARGLALVKSNFWYAVLLILLGMGISIAGMLGCCVGILFAAPIFWLTMGIGYNELTGGIAYVQAPEPTDQSGS